MRIGIDLGGTKIEGIALDEAGNELLRHRVATPTGNYAASLQAIVDLVLYIENKIGTADSIGIGTPGAISPATGLLRNSNSVCLNGQPLQADLQKLLKRDISMANDANCFALSEATDGAEKGAAVVFGVIIGTGTGAGVVVNGQVLNGANAIAGEWGHNPLPWTEDHERPGPDCYCGKQGCIETFLSGPGMALDFTQHTGEQLSAEQIVALAGQQGAVNQAQAEDCLQRYINRLARSLAHVINILDPDVIVLGGGLSNIQRLYADVPQQLSQYVFSDVVKTKLVPPRYGDSSGVRGAAWLPRLCARNDNFASY
ncbi:MAG TPA: ROK family protein [Gammaproteobacteria bacterium]